MNINASNWSKFTCYRFTSFLIRIYILYYLYKCDVPKFYAQSSIHQNISDLIERFEKSLKIVYRLVFADNLLFLLDIFGLSIGLIFKF